MKQLLKVTLTLALITFTLPAFAKMTYGQSLCKKNSDYTCYRVKRGDSWRRLFPNEQKRDLVKRLNRQNIRLRRGMVIAIPKDDVDFDYYSIAPFPLKLDTGGHKLMIFNPAKLAWAAYDKNGDLLR